MGWPFRFLIDDLDEFDREWRDGPAALPIFCQAD